jgi:hypothetical protein
MTSLDGKALLYKSIVFADPVINTCLNVVKKEEPIFENFISPYP